MKRISEMSSEEIEEMCCNSEPVSPEEIKKAFDEKYEEENERSFEEEQWFLREIQEPIFLYKYKKIISLGSKQFLLWNFLHL